MMLEAIGSILRPKFVQGGLHDDAIYLDETAEKSLCKTIRLKKRGPALVLKLDNQVNESALNDVLFPLFNTAEANLTCICDYIVFFEAPKRGDQRLFVFLCELKSGNPSGAVRQLRNGRLMADFIIAMARHHKPVVRPSAVEYRGLIFATKVLSPKGGIKPVDSRPYLADDKMPDLECARFACASTLQLELLCA